MRDQFAASHLVAHDALRRGPRERAQMLRSMGVTKIIWDWRDEHIDTFDAELDALRARVRRLLRTGVFPVDRGGRRVPWPLV